MKKTAILILSVILLVATGYTQDRFFTKSGKISFFSKATLENIEAHHKSVTCVLDTKTGNLQFAVLMKGFEFEKALMQEHFNENYVESHKFPKAEFKGQVANNSEVNYAVDGIYKVIVKGKLTLHGQTRDVESPGTLVVKNGKIDATASFNVMLADYSISVPALVKENISKSINIQVNCILEPLKS